MKSSRWIMLPISLLLFGCQPNPTCIDVVNKRTGHLTVRFAGGMNCDRRTYIDKVLFIRGSTGRSPHLWIVYASAFENLTELRYGVVPEGFEQTEAKELQPGEVITIIVDGIGDNSLTFTLDE